MAGDWCPDLVHQRVRRSGFGFSAQLTEQSDLEALELGALAQE